VDALGGNSKRWGEIVHGCEKAELKRWRNESVEADAQGAGTPVRRCAGALEMDALLEVSRRIEANA
jgi:hypothetical protein